MPLKIQETADISPPNRDSVRGLGQNSRPPPSIVSISDIHGYLESARSALLTLRDHSDFAPVVVADADGTLHWASENYVLMTAWRFPYLRRLPEGRRTPEQIR